MIKKFYLFLWQPAGLPVMLIFFLNFAGTVFSQMIPLEEKSKYEKALEHKVDEVLMRILGPNQGKSFIQATIDFSRVEKIEANVDSRSKEKENPFFKWFNISTMSAETQYLLPGYTVPSKKKEGYQTSIQFPVSFLKKLDVTIVLNTNVEESAAANIRIIVADLLSLDTARGDKLSIVRAPFAPLWKTVWYMPETMSLIFKYIALTLMGIIAIIVMAIGFLKLASAMSSMARTQTHEISMDFTKSNAILEDAMSGGIPPALPAPEKRKEIEETTGEGEIEKPVVFNVKIEQVPFLVNMMDGEDPANVGIVAAHLEPDIRAEFFRCLSPKFVSEIIANMAKVRFVEPDIILTLKDVIENRLRGAVGGVDKILEAIDKVDSNNKKKLLEELKETHPELFQEVRKRVFLIEDIELLNDKDISILVSSVTIEDWATALWVIPANIRDKIKAQMLEKTWQMIEQTMSYGTPPKEKIEHTIEKILNTTVRLMKEGKIGAVYANQ